ncbi:MAG: hypothetical protein ACLR30_08245 [[Clostridium] leptum]
MSQPDGLGELVATKETDEDGEILFTGLEPGDYMRRSRCPLISSRAPSCKRLRWLREKPTKPTPAIITSSTTRIRAGSPLPNSWATAKLR